MSTCQNYHVEEQIIGLHSMENGSRSEFGSPNYYPFTGWTLQDEICFVAKLFLEEIILIQKKKKKYYNKITRVYIYINIY